MLTRQRQFWLCDGLPLRQMILQLQQNCVPQPFPVGVLVSYLLFAIFNYDKINSQAHSPPIFLQVIWAQPDDRIMRLPQPRFGHTLDISRSFLTVASSSNSTCRWQMEGWQL